MFNRRFNTTVYNDVSVKPYEAEIVGEGTTSPYSVLVMIGRQTAIGKGVVSPYSVIRLMIGRTIIIAKGVLGLALVVKRRSPKLLTIMGKGYLTALWSSTEHGPFTKWDIKKLGKHKEI